MPRYDGTGPERAGPLTGWGDGDCIDEKVESTEQNPVTDIRRRPMRRRAFLTREYGSRIGRRGRGVRGLGRRRRGRW